MAKISVRHIDAGSPLSSSKLADFAINPYVGCPFACRYCYACFTKERTHSDEKWGEFVDVKNFSQPINLAKIRGKSIIISPISDCYNPFEAKFYRTQEILKQLAHASPSRVRIITKSRLVLRDVEILKQIPNVEVAISLNTLNKQFARDMDLAGSPDMRLKTLEILHSHGIKTILFISPIFIGITDAKALIERTFGFADEIWFEALNLRYPYKSPILAYIAQNFSHLGALYERIYIKNDSTPLRELRDELVGFCLKNGINFKDFMFHSETMKSRTCSKKIYKPRQPSLF